MKDIFDCCIRPCEEPDFEEESGGPEEGQGGTRVGGGEEIVVPIILWGRAGIVGVGS